MKLLLILAVCLAIVSAFRRSPHYRRAYGYPERGPCVEACNFFTKSTRAARNLQQAINAALDDLISSGDWQDIREGYLGSPGVPPSFACSRQDYPRRGYWIKKLKECGQLRFGYKVLSPSAFVDSTGSVTGIYPDFARAVTKALNYNYGLNLDAVFVAAPLEDLGYYEDFVFGMQNQRFEVSLGPLSITESRREFGYFTCPFDVDTYVFVIAEGVMGTFTSLDDISGYTIGVNAGSPEDQFLTQSGLANSNAIRRTADTVQLLELIYNGSVNFIFGVDTDILPAVTAAQNDDPPQCTGCSSFLLPGLDQIGFATLRRPNRDLQPAP